MKKEDLKLELECTQASLENSREYEDALRKELNETVNKYHKTENNLLWLSIMVFALFLSTLVFALKWFDTSGDLKDQIYLTEDLSKNLQDRNIENNVLKNKMQVAASKIKHQLDMDCSSRKELKDALNWLKIEPESSIHMENATISSDGHLYISIPNIVQ